MYHSSPRRALATASLSPWNITRGRSLSANRDTKNRWFVALYSALQTSIICGETNRHHPAKLFRLGNLAILFRVADAGELDVA